MPASTVYIYLVYIYIQLYHELWDHTHIINEIDWQQFIILNTSAIVYMHDVRILDSFPSGGHCLAV